MLFRTPLQLKVELGFSKAIDYAYSNLMLLVMNVVHVKNLKDYNLGNIDTRQGKVVHLDFLFSGVLNSKFVISSNS